MILSLQVVLSPLGFVSPQELPILIWGITMFVLVQFGFEGLFIELAL
jgi:hypothetical protein